MVKIKDVCSRQTLFHLGIWGLCRLLRLSTEGRKAGTDDVHHRIGFFSNRKPQRWWQLTFTNFWGGSTQMYNFNNLISTYFYIINIHHLPHQSQLHFGIGVELSLLGTFGQRNHQWIVGSASSHRPHWRPECCLPVAFGGSKGAKVLQRIFTVFWNSGYLKNRMMVLHLNWRCAGPFTEILCSQITSHFHSFQTKMMYIYIMYIYIYSILHV